MPCATVSIDTHKVCAIFAVVKPTQDLTMLSTHGVVLSDRDRELAVTSASQPSHAANSGTLMSCFPILPTGEFGEYHPRAIFSSSEYIKSQLLNIVFEKKSPITMSSYSVRRK